MTAIICAGFFCLLIPLNAVLFGAKLAGGFNVFCVMVAPLIAACFLFALAAGALT